MKRKGPVELFEEFLRKQKERKISKKVKKVMWRKKCIAAATFPIQIQTQLQSSGVKMQNAADDA